MNGVSLDEKYARATEVVCRQGLFPFPVNQTTLSILHEVIEDDEDELDFIHAFRHKASQSLEELQTSSGLPPERIETLAGRLARKGLIFNQPSSSGLMVFRLLPLMTVGLMEYLFMGELQGTDKERRLAQLFSDLISEVRDQVQDNYDRLMPAFQAAPAVDRTVPARRNERGEPIRILPVQRSLEAPTEVILPSQSVEEIIGKFDQIAVGHCFCRQRRKVLGEPCATDAPLMNCFTFGKSARHTAAQGFAKMITREEALRVMQEAEDAGLVHKAFHPGSQEARPETSICNCCKDCCDTLNVWRRGALPLINSTYYLSMIDAELCTGCGICEERCPTEAVRVTEAGTAERDEACCFGCGVCARFCPEGAISLKQGLRKVFVLPPRLRRSA